MVVPVTVLRTGGPRACSGPPDLPWLAETYLADRGVVEQVRIWRGRQRAAATRTVPWAAHAELAQDRRHVVVDCAARQDQPRGDLGVAQPGREQPQDFGFPAGGGSDAGR